MKTNRNQGEIGVFGFSAKNIRLYAFQAFVDALAICRMRLYGRSFVSWVIAYFKVLPLFGTPLVRLIWPVAVLPEFYIGQENIKSFGNIGRAL
jgi:hypothetical protein